MKSCVRQQPVIGDDGAPTTLALCQDFRTGNRLFYCSYTRLGHVGHIEYCPCRFLPSVRWFKLLAERRGGNAV